MLALVVVALSMLALVAVGLIKARQVHDQAGFALAGRSLSPLVLVGTLLATWTGTGSIFGNAEQAYEVGLPALILPLAAAAGIVVLVVMIPGVRARGRFTLQDVLEQRFGPAARVLGTLTLVAAYLVIVSYQLRAAAVVLETVAGHALTEMAPDDPWRDLIVDAHVPILVGVALLIGLYTALAGLMSVALTDTLNGLLMVGGVAAALPLVVHAVGGWDQVVAGLPEGGRQLGGHYSLPGVVSVLLPSFLLLVGDANLHQRFLAAPSAAAARRAAWLLIPGVLLIDGLILLTALAGRALLPELEEPGQVILQVALVGLPDVLGALLVAAILAIIVSTADSFLLSSSSALVHDVYRRFLRPDLGDREAVRACRLAVALLTAVALGLAFTSDRFFDVALFAYTLYGVGITPVLLAALFWRRATPAGALASMVTALTTALAWEIGGGEAWAAAHLGLPEDARVGAVIPAVLVAGLVLVAVSLVTRPRDEGAAA